MAELYVPLDVNAPDDPKIIAAGDAGELVFYRSLCMAKRLQSDGFIARAQLRRLGASPKTARALVDAGLWVETEDGYLIASFLKRNPSRVAVEKDRKANADRKAAWRATRDANATRDIDGTDPRRDAGHERRATHSEVKRSDSEVNIPPGGAHAPPNDDQQSPTTVELVAGYVDDYRATHAGQSPIRPWRDQAGQHVKNLLGEGVDPAVLAACLTAIAKENKSPSVLAHVLADHQAEEAS